MESGRELSLIGRNIPSLSHRRKYQLLSLILIQGIYTTNLINLTHSTERTGSIVVGEL